MPSTSSPPTPQAPLRSIRPSGRSLVAAVALAGCVLLASTYAADRIRSSELYSKSRLISMIVTQGQVGIADVAGNKRNVDMMLKFVGALTSAYIDFELIPVGEVGTFAAVFESAPPEILIDKFEYHRKNLTITGSAPDQESYETFLHDLRETRRFEGVTGHYYLDTDDRIRFELECISKATAIHLEF